MSKDTAKGAEKMNTEPQGMPDQEDLRQHLLENLENRDTLSERGRMVLRIAISLAHERYMMCSCLHDPQGYEETIDKMVLVADELTDEDCRFLAKRARAALAEAASIDSDDEDLRIGNWVYVRDCYLYFKEIADILGYTLNLKRTE